eukprot:gene25817-1446_t
MAQCRSPVFAPLEPLGAVIGWRCKGSTRSTSKKEVLLHFKHQREGKSSTAQYPETADLVASVKWQWYKQQQVDERMVAAGSAHQCLPSTPIVKRRSSRNLNKSVAAAASRTQAQAQRQLCTKPAGRPQRSVGVVTDSDCSADEHDPVAA